MTAVLAALVAATGSCVVSPTPTLFQDPNQCNPHFLSDQATPGIDKIASRDPTIPSEAQFTASVPLESCNLTQSYQAQVFIDSSATPVSFLDEKGDVVTIDDVPSNGTDLRRVQITVQVAGDLAEGCHRIELYVSGQFREPKQPLRSGDLAVIVWFVDVHTSGSTDHGVLDCNK